MLALAARSRSMASRSLRDCERGATRVFAEANSTFDGVFTTDFSSEKVLTNTHSLASVVPSAIPEPATLVVFLACGAGLLYRGRRRIAAADLIAR